MTDDQQQPQNGAHDPEMIDVEYATGICNCEAQSIIERLRSGELPGLKFGRSWVIPRRAFFERLNEIALAESEQRRQQHVIALAQAPVPVKRPRGRPRKHIQVGNTT